MANYQQYQRYHAQPEQKGFKFGKILIILGIIVVLYLIGRALFGGSQPATVVSDENANANTAVINSEINANGNANATIDNANTNLNANIDTATAGNFEVEKCQSVYSRGQTGDKRVALTFNVGTSKEGEIQKVLEGLQSSGQTAADFFARGDVAENSPDLINKISGAGFPVYNLSYSYPHFNDLPESGIAEQLAKADSAISQRTSKTTKPFFRPPYGETLDADVLSAVKTAGYCAVTWSIDAMDWSADYTADQSKERVLSKVTNGSIVLMQASNSTTAQILPEVISQLKAQGYSLVHLDELL